MIIASQRPVTSALTPTGITSPCKEHYLRREFSYSNYEQALTLPEDVEKDKIEAKVDNGVLHITLPRTQKAEKETKRIEVA